LKRNSLLDAPQYLALKEAVQNVHPVQVRNVATIGGSLCSSLPQYDPPVSLWALDANVVVIGPNQERTVHVNEFSKGLLSPDLNPGEMVKEILISKFDSGVGSSYLKLGRTRFDYGLVTVASLIEVDKDGVLKRVRVVLGNYDEEKPFRALEVENALIGRKVSFEIVNEAVRRLDNTSPHSLHASAAYRKEVAKTLVTQSLLESHRRAIRL
jgi:CO/xanthine dehydrogenase FAD-binding subunit